MYSTTTGPKCDMKQNCEQPVTMLDQDGYVYCTEHGLQRRDWQPCRQLRTYELNHIRRGEPLKHY